MASVQWGYVGKAPPRSNTSHKTSSAPREPSRDLPAASQVPPTQVMLPRARPTSRPVPAPESQALPLGVELPTSFRFLRRDTVTPATAHRVPLPMKVSEPVTSSGPASESGKVRFNFFDNLHVLNALSCQNSSNAMAIDPEASVSGPDPANVQGPSVRSSICSHSLDLTPNSPECSARYPAICK